MVKKTVQRGRSKRRDEAYFELYGESLSDARTKLADFFNILLDSIGRQIVRIGERLIFCRTLARVPTTY